MIICGYPCIGKTTLASKDPRIIDLESSFFKVDGRRNDGWEVGYCNMAFRLHETGHIVFTSTHKEVIDQLIQFANFKTYVGICYPDSSLHDEWIRRASERYERTGSQKDLMALKRIEEHWDEDIATLQSYDQVCKICIMRTDYDFMNHILGMGITL